MADSRVTKTGTGQRTVASTTAGDTVNQPTETPICGGCQ